MEDDKLLPCPFCGECDGVYSEIMGPHVVIVRCSNCNATHCCKTITEAIERWNRRVPITVKIVERPMKAE